MSQTNLVFYGTADDKEYLSSLKSCVGGATTYIKLDKVTTITEVVMYCAPRNISGILSTSVALLAKLLNTTSSKAPSLSSYAGSLFILPGTTIEVVFINPLKQTWTVAYGRFLLKRYADKLVRKDKGFLKLLSIGTYYTLRI